MAHLTTFSFHPVKTITTGEGGAVLTNDATLGAAGARLSQPRAGARGGRLGPSDPTGPGTTRFSRSGSTTGSRTSSARSGAASSRSSSASSSRRAEIVKRYREGLAEVGALRLPGEAEWARPAWHLFAVRVRAGRAQRDALHAALRTHGIGTQVHYIPTNSFPLYRQLGYDAAATPVASRIADEILSLPLFPAMSDADVTRVISTVRAVVRELA